MPQQTKNTSAKIIVALDFSSAADAVAMAQTLSGTGVKFKIGMELYYAEGHTILEKIQRFGAVFLDLKLHDIPETMAKAASVLCERGAWMFNVHASAGEPAMKRVAESVHETCAKKNLKQPLVIAVTILTSLANLNHLSATNDANTIAMNLAKLTKDAGLNGVVCSPRDVSAIKTLGKDFLCVTPGIRGPQDAASDQVRTATPKEALQAGSDYLVIGRPITKAKDPLAALTHLMTG